MKKEELLNQIADCAYDLISYATPLQEDFNPSSYEINADYVLKLADLLSLLEEVESDEKT